MRLHYWFAIDADKQYHFIQKMSDQIRILKLVDGEHNDGVLYRLQKGWRIHFMLGPTLASQNVSIYTNVPIIGQNFNRTKYHLLEWNTPTNKSGDEWDYFAPITLNIPGSFQYFFEHSGEKRGKGYFTVDPVLTIGKDNHILPLDAICMHTVLPKSLGLFSTWKDRLLVSLKSGYNVIHFTPIQKLGSSNSSYSIADQLSLNSSFSCETGKPVTLKQINELVDEMQRDWSILSVTDVVWNHTANNSEWLKKNPECAYNLFNSPYLRPAYLLDRALFQLTLDINKGVFDAEFPKRQISSQSDVDSLRKILETKVLPALELHEFFQVDVKKEVERFRSKKVTCVKLSDHNSGPRTISIIQNEAYTRFGCTVDMDIAAVQFASSESKNKDESEQNLMDTLLWLNKVKQEEVEKDLKAAINNILSTIVYERLDDNGPHHKEISAEFPLVTSYFLQPFPHTTVVNEEMKIMNDTNHCKLIMAHNGWVMGADALKNFADSPGSVYFRRELICWGDSVKLRYGSCPGDCPALWNRMKKYTETMAKVFHGIRIDNCHSTPIHVAEYMLDAARTIRPDLYVFAELFTGSEAVDNIFVNRLGLTSLIREALNAWDAHELGRLVYLYGGEPIASFTQPCSQILTPCRAHALFYDITHDNESMITKRSIYDLIPSSALVAMSSCAVGSNRGHDEMTPHHIHVVNEKRFYRKWADHCNSNSMEFASPSSGMIRVKYFLNKLHNTLAINDFNQVFVDQRSADVVAVTRHNSQTHHSYVLVAHTSFNDLPNRTVASMTIEGRIEKIVVEVKPKEVAKSTCDYIQSFSRSDDFINGIENFELHVASDLNPSESTCCKIHQDSSEKSSITFNDFPPGSVIVVQVKMNDAANEATTRIRKLIRMLSANKKSIFDDIATQLSLGTMNRVLFRCDAEERSDGLGIGVYNIPGYGSLTYCGIAGIALQMAKIRNSNDLGHPICTNLRDGNWLLDYISSRLQKHKETLAIGNWYAESFEILKMLPRYLIPTYFEIVITFTFEKLLRSCWSNMSDFIQNGSSFVQQLSLGTVVMCGDIKDANLPPLLPDVGECDKACLSMAAGLPHFSSGIMRCWGRDTFIAMHGLQLVTGQYRAARNLILSFASCLRHGLIPNLLGEGKVSRYNCRDAVWFWLQCIQDLCKADGYGLLQLPVARIYPSDDSEPCKIGDVTQPLYQVMQEALQKHASGISFKERNAGQQIDMHMTDQGFHVNAAIDLKTGFVFGGNEFNCGTWMDKMGESEKAGTKGVPATPRDGSAVELVGLCKSTVMWLSEVFKQGKYPYDGVTVSCDSGTNVKMLWSEWSDKILENFEKQFYISSDHSSHLVNRRHIYKDTVGASHPWCDYQLRPNFPIAMVYAPELFDPKKAWKALEIAQDCLLGPLGMKTLDPSDMQYRGNYDNSNDSDDRSVAKGFNYHQGPEWLWPVGYFMRAKLYFAKILGKKQLDETLHFIQKYVVTHHLHLEASSWCGLPELTDSNGSFCRDSCPIQAWSHGTLLDVFYDISKLSV